MIHELNVTHGGRLDLYLAENLTEHSRTKLQRLIKDGHATVNDALILDPNFTVEIGQVVRFIDPEPDPDFPHAEPTPLTIIYEDDDILVIDKPVGMVTHPNTFHDSGTLVQAVLHHYPEVKNALYDPKNPVSRLRPGIVHRLDKDTSGLLVVAKSREALLNLADQFHKRKVHKAYETFLYGALREPRTVSAPIHRKTGTTNVMVASHDPGQGRAAITHFEPLETSAPYSKWPDELATRTKVTIETGRTHQIRVHAKFIGHPVLGDLIYGNKPSEKLSEKLELHTQQLRAVFLSFTHPKNGEVVSYSLL